MTIPDKEKKMMSTYLLFAVLVASVSHMETSGVKMFLTKNGMQYGKFRSRHLPVFCKITFTPVTDSLFNRVAGLRPTIVLKKALVQVLNRYFCDVFKNIFLFVSPLVTISFSSKASV